MKDSYYQKNKSKWKKGGEYYKYKSVDDRRSKISITIKRGYFIISFN